MYRIFCLAFVRQLPNLLYSIAFFVVYITDSPFCCYFYMYRIAGKFGRGEVWQIDSFQAFGERKFGELIDQSIDYLL